MRHAVHGEGVEPDLFCHEAPRTAQVSLAHPPGSNAGLLPEIVASPLRLARPIPRTAHFQPPPYPDRLRLPLSANKGKKYGRSSRRDCAGT
jgi:hypothetical protein